MQVRAFERYMPLKDKIILYFRPSLFFFNQGRIQAFWKGGSYV